MTLVPALLVIPLALLVAWGRGPARTLPPGTTALLVRPRSRASTLDVARMVERLAVVFSSGSPIRQAWRIVGESLPPGDLSDLAQRVSAGADPRRAGRRSLAHSAEIRSLGAALEVCERSGAPMAALLDGLAGALRGLHDAAAARRSAFAGPRATGRILLGLPLAGVALGALLGADPLRTLVGTGAGRVLLVTGGALTLGGWWWMRSLMRTAEGRVSTAVDPSVLLDLVAGAMTSGLPLAGACEVVAHALSEDRDSHGAARDLDRFAQSLASGVPATLAAAHLDPSLAVLGQSALLAERSGADLTRVLSGAAQDARRDRAREAEAAAARLAVRLVLPTGTTLLPAFVLLGIIPTVASLLGGSLGVQTWIPAGT
ncbi:pilus assembly protein TadB [Brachybacterium endophyticum]|uniref:Pilus assembly protein TadB n=1 Tax=Brachybacterium endophyticum TaxID=2182385 RepID=A0A2U2RKX1_9MICO|nr:type II secretion system F family protein [Brachybacterium endophyticum]PWH06513.1 pilus assembly protein TadB [Brachybacterium endophyticum]